MPVPIVYRKSAEGAIATYSYLDIAEGTGIAKFYLAQSVATATLSQILTGDSTMNTTEEAGGSTLGRIYTLSPAGTINFDLSPFNTPKRIKGTGYFDFEAVAESGTRLLKIQIKKVSGGVETDVSSEVIVSIGTASDRFLAKLPITTQINFAKGDILRLSLTSSDDFNIKFGTDPQGNSAGAPVAVNDTKSTLSVPFALDL